MRHTDRDNPRCRCSYSEAVLSSQKTLIWVTLSISWETCLQASRNLIEPPVHREKLLGRLAPELSYLVFNHLTSPTLGLEMTKEEAKETPYTPCSDGVIANHTTQGTNCMGLWACFGALIYPVLIVTTRYLLQKSSSTLL
jgi:hypothetical protein